MTSVSSMGQSPATRASIYQAASAGAIGRQAQLTARWASNASLIASLGAHGAQTQTYNAAGMLNLLPPAKGSGKPAIMPAGGAPATSHGPAKGSTDIAGNWVHLLHARPQMAFTATAYLVNQGIVANL